MSAPLPSPGPVRAVLDRLSLRQRQYLLLAAILAGGLGLLWLVFLFSDGQSRGASTRSNESSNTSTKQLGVMPAGAQVNPVDQWVGRPNGKNTRCRVRPRIGVKHRLRRHRPEAAGWWHQRRRADATCT